jgi:hypothetical protein
MRSPSLHLTPPPRPPPPRFATSKKSTRMQWDSGTPRKASDASRRPSARRIHRKPNGDQSLSRSTLFRAPRMAGLSDHAAAQAGTYGMRDLRRVARKSLRHRTCAVRHPMCAWMLVSCLLLLALPACGTTGGEQTPRADAGADSGPAHEDSGPVSPPCGWIGLTGLDASCATGSDCHAGQACVVAEGCFCSSEGRCIDRPCDGGALSTECAETVCHSAISGSANPDAGIISCFVSGC